MFKRLFTRQAKTPNAFYVSGINRAVTDAIESSVEAAVGLYENLTAELPLMVYRDNLPHKTHRLSGLLADPDPALNRGIMMARAVRNLLLDGNCYFRIEREALKLVWRSEDCAGGEKGGLVYYQIGGRSFLYEDIAHIRQARGSEVYRGQPKLDAISNTLQALKERQETIAEYGFQGKGFIKGLAGVKSDKSKAFQQKLADFVKDSGFAFLNLTEASEVFTWSPDFRVAAFIEFQKAIRHAVFQVFGIPLFLISSEKSNSYKAATESLNIFVRTALSGVLSLFESEFSHKLLSKDDRRNNVKIQFDLSQLLKADAETRVKNIALLTGQKPVMTPNDARKEMGLEPIEGGDNLDAIPSP